MKVVRIHKRVQSLDYSHSTNSLCKNKALPHTKKQGLFPEIKPRQPSMAIDLDLRISMAQMTKAVLYSEKKLKHMSKYNGKMKRFEIRNNKHLTSAIKRSWISYLAIVSIPTTLKYLSLNRKELKKRSNFNLRWLFTVLRCVGRIILIAKSIRFRRSMIVFRVHLNIRIKRWVKRTRLKFNNMVIELIEHSLTNAMMFNMMVRFRDKVLTVQRSMKTLLEEKSHMYNHFLNIWNMAELSTSKRDSYKRTSTIAKKNMRRATIAGTSTLTEELKIIYIRETIRNAVQRYHALCSEYYATRRNINALSFEEKLSQGYLDERFRIIKLLRPLKPSIKIVLNEDIVRKLVVKGLIDRSNWQALIQNQNRKLQLSYFLI